MRYWNILDRNSLCNHLTIEDLRLGHFRGILMGARFTTTSFKNQGQKKRPRCIEVYCGNNLYTYVLVAIFYYTAISLTGYFSILLVGVDLGV